MRAGAIAQASIVINQPVSFYARELRDSLPPRAFNPEPLRSLWLLGHLAIVVVGTVAIAHKWGGWPATLAFTLVIGHSFGAMAFVGHELLHGAVVRNLRARAVLGWLAFLPFTLSPRLWVAWHNGAHHGHTGRTGTDPDTYPRLWEYRGSRLIRAIDHISVGNRRWGGLVTLLIGFTAQNLTILIQGGPQFGLTRRQRQLAAAETLAGMLVWGAVGLAFGAHTLLFAYGLPLLVGNALVMVYILTNHSLNPLTDLNDPLVNSLCVTAPRFIELLHLNFGYHVEHHIFPAMSSRHGPALRRALRARYPERYQSMPMGRALLRLFRTPRIYKDSVTLLDPRTGIEAATLQART